MPLYEYQCESCAHRFERIQKFSDPPIETCPVCSGPVRKLLSSPAIQFKGSGWYITDYARKAPAESSAKTGAESTPKTGADSTPSSPAAEAKTESKAADTKTE